MSNTKETCRKIAIRIADWFNRHWICKTIILFLPAVYMPIAVEKAGVQMGLTDDSGVMTLRGWILTLIIYVLALVVDILSSYKAKRDKMWDAERDRKHKKEVQKYQDEIRKYKNTLNVHVVLMNAIGNVCDLKLTTIGNYISDSLAGQTFRKPFNETVDPQRQLCEIAKEIKHCLSEITPPPPSNISVSMAYEFPESRHKVDWIDPQEVNQCMQLRQLKKNKKTVFYQEYKGFHDFLFYNDKASAAAEGQYVFDKKDERNHRIGSIICDEISIIEKDKKIARIILTISTYGYRFTDSKDETVLSNMSQMIQEVLLQQFEKRIRIELALMYVKKRYNADN